MEVQQSPESFIRRLPSVVNHRGQLWRITKSYGTTTDINSYGTKTDIKITHRLTNAPMLIPSPNHCSKFVTTHDGRIYDIERDDDGCYVTNKDESYIAVASSLTEDRASDMILALDDTYRLTIMIYKLEVDSREIIDGITTQIMRVPISSIIPLFLIYRDSKWERLTMVNGVITIRPMEGDMPDIEDVIEIREGLILTLTKAYALTARSRTFSVYDITPMTLVGLIEFAKIWHLITIDEQMNFTSYRMNGNVMTSRHSRLLADIDRLHSIIGFIRTGECSDILLCRDGCTYHIIVDGHIKDNFLLEEIFATDIPVKMK